MLLGLIIGLALAIGAFGFGRHLGNVWYDKELKYILHPEKYKKKDK